MELEHPRVWRSSVSGRYYKQPEPQVFEAQMITPEDISSIEAVTILDEVLGLARPQYKLRQICRLIRMDSLTANVDVATKLTGQEKVPPLVEAEIAAEAYTRVGFDLWKNVTHVALSDEALKKAAHDILGLHVSDAAKELGRMENKQVAEEMPSATDQAAGGAWDAMTTPPTSDNNPFEDILTALDTLDGKGYPANWAVMNPKVWKAFITNSYVKDLVHAGIARLGALGGEFSLPGYPNVRVLVDHAVTPNTSCYIMSSDAPALVMGEGPTEAARYRDEKAGYYAYIIRQWLQPKLVLGDAIREITGAHS
jgi:hypothetical protein